MSTRTFVMVVALAVAPVAKGEVLVELVPDRSGPYNGGESLTVDVWFHSEVSFDVRLQHIQFDFSDTDPALALNPTFTFDYSSIPDDSGYQERHPELLVPWTANWLECGCPEAFLPLPAGGSLHIGSIVVTLPIAGGAYRLDALNADEPDPSRGAMLNVRGPVWRAFTGELTGGSFDFVVTPAIPTLSDWGTIVMTCLLLVLGAMIIVRRDREVKRSTPASGVQNRRGVAADLRVIGIGICAPALFLGLGQTLLAQPAPIQSEIVVVSIDSGAVSATGTGTDPVVVHSEVASVPGAPWIRLHIQRAQLSGSATGGNQSFLRITSLEDGAVQVLDSLTLKRWRNTSAYFNGDAVLVEVLAYPGTGANRVVIEKTVAGVRSQSDSAQSLCGDDDRVPSTDPRAGRVLPVTCTAFLFNDHPRCLLTAGHCVILGGGLDCMQFNVPPSDCDGTINHPGTEHQYAVDQASIQFQPDGIGNDWCQFGVFDNTNTGLSPLEAQGASYLLVQIVPDADESTLRITGYGLDKTPPGCCDAPACTICGAAACGVGQRNEDNHTEQTDSGPYREKDGTTVKYVIDTTGGNSGSAVEHVSDGLVYAIHTHGGCNTVGVNHGTAVDHPGLQDALACPIGVCAEALVGACCIPDGSCRVFPEYCCTDAGGTFLGDGTTCTPAGACCMGNGFCQNGVSEACCEGAGGTFNGPLTTCEPLGACCDGFTPQCIETIESCCDSPFDRFHPNDTCATIFPCPTALGPQPGG